MFTNFTSSYAYLHPRVSSARRSKTRKSKETAPENLHIQGVQVITIKSNIQTDSIVHQSQPKSG